LDRDRDRYFKFGALQSEEGKNLLLATGQSPDYLDSIVLIEKGRVYRDSDAALHVAQKLGGLWPLMYAFIIVPRVLRDGVYKWIAKNRYTWFGKMDVCRIPTPENQSRFI